MTPNRACAGSRDARATGVKSPPIDRSPSQAAELPEDRARPVWPGDLGAVRRRPRSTSPTPRASDLTLDQFRGKNVILTFYLGAGCAHCVKQVKDLAERSDEWARLDTVVITVSQDEPEKNAKSQELVTAQGDARLRRATGRTRGASSRTTTSRRWAFTRRS